MKTWQEIVLVALVCGAGFLVAYRWRRIGGELTTSVIVIVALLLLGFIAFGLFAFVLPTSTVLAGWTAALFMGSHVDWSLRRLGLRHLCV
jgi:hypothetical protein